LIGIVIASILAVASVTATAAVAGVALHQGIQTADFMRTWHQDAHLLWQQQKDLDSQLATDVINLQHTVSWLGDQVTILATRSVLKCDWNSSHICVTLVPYNTSDSWETVKRRLNGHQNLTLEIMNLEKTIMDTFSKTLPELTGSDILQKLSSSIANLNPLSHFSTLLSTSLGNTVIIFVLYIVFQCWKKRRQLKHETCLITSAMAHLQKQKEGDVENQM
uniref:Retroviral envelope protein GP41-like domain-containing protein n=1 Tax=Marmota marmota marmota TaxID=9994 RepID=A0A8C5YIK2_MARMA